MHWRATPACLGFIQWRMTECWPLLIYATKPCGGQLYRIFTFCAYRVTHNSFIIQVLSWIPEELPASSVASSPSAIHHLHPEQQTAGLVNTHMKMQESVPGSTCYPSSNARQFNRPQCPFTCPNPTTHACLHFFVHSWSWESNVTLLNSDFASPKFLQAALNICLAVFAVIRVQ